MSSLVESTPRYRQPAESAPHAATWMQWPHQLASFEAADFLTAARRHIARLACTIAEFEKVVMLAHPDDAAVARALCGSAIDILPMPLDNMWARDSCPVFVVDQQNKLAAVDFHFNGWGRKDVHGLDRSVASRLAHHLQIPLLEGGMVTEGGAWDTDGAGTFLTTESAVLNANRNPKLTKAQALSAMRAATGAEKIIWLPGAKGTDITDTHIDGLARFVAPGLVVVEQADATRNAVQAWLTEEALRILKQAEDAAGRKLDIVALHQASHLRPDAAANPDFFAGYINYYVCNDAVIIPAFGDTAADANARSLIAELHPGRNVVALNVDNICAYGGGIHCVTQQQPAT